MLSQNLTPHAKKTQVKSSDDSKNGQLTLVTGVPDSISYVAVDCPSQCLHVQFPARPNRQLLRLGPCNQTDTVSLPAQLIVLAFALSHNIAHQVNTNSAVNLKSQHAALDPSLPGSRSEEALPSTAPPQRAHISAEKACHHHWTNNTLCTTRD